MNTVDIDIAKKQFCGPVAVGEYVAWWECGGHSLVAAEKSYPTIKVCELAAVLLSVMNGDGLCESAKLDIHLVIGE